MRTTLLLALTAALLTAASTARAQTVDVPAGLVGADSQSVDVFVNVWAEHYAGSDEVRLQPAPHLAPETNYLLVVDVALIPYFSGNGPHAEPHGVTVRARKLAAALQKDVDRDDWRDRYASLITQLVIADEAYLPFEANYFAVHGPRHDVSYMSDLRRARADFLQALKRPVPRGVMALMRERATDAGTARPVWLLSRSVFRLRVRARTGAAPLGIALRELDGSLLDTVSARFCIEPPAQADGCRHLPRESESMAHAISSRPPPLPEGVTPTAMAETASTSPPALRPTWNSWLTPSGAATSDPLEALELDADAVQREYDLHLDLSLFTYASVLGLPPDVLGHARPDRSFRELLRARLARGDRTLQLVARAEAVGGAIALTRGRVQRLEVDLQRLDPATVSAEPTPRGLTVDALSSRAAAASLTFGVRPEAAGCGAVAVSIADASGVRPLDQLMVDVEVRDPSQADSTCRRSGVNALRAGLATMLGHEGAPPVDAALHVFEDFPGDRRTAAAFLIGAGDLHYAWELARPLTEYLSDPKNLEQRIAEARERTLDGVANAYDRAAQELAGAIFSGADRRAQREADAARAALVEFARNAAQPPTLLARLVDARGDVLFVPLGLLAAPGTQAVLEKPIEVVLPLATEDYGESGCLKHWSLAVSDTLEGGEPVPVPEELKDPGQWLGESLEGLRGYLADTASAGGEGLVLAAHHDGGRLRYRQNDFPLQTHEVRRDYGKGTAAAVLAMCRAGGVAPVEHFFIARLNRFGLDAAILSPFSLDALYGKTFAIEFSRAVRQQRGQTPTLRELFHIAASATRSSLAGHADPRVRGPVGDMHLELILVGNPEIRLCAN